MREEGPVPVVRPALPDAIKAFFDQTESKKCDKPARRLSVAFPFAPA
jgi:hypothetical protein